MRFIDVIVVGSGPGGAMTAITLAKRGYSVLVFEKHSLPRHKPCGGAVSAKAGELLGFPLGALSKSRIYRARLGVISGPWADIDYGENHFADIVERKEFDHHLVRIAGANGAVIHEREEFKHLVDCGDNVIVETNRGKYKGRFIVGADGALSTVRKHLGLRWKPAWGFALEGTYLFARKTKGFDPESLIIDLSRQEKGYSWIFPRGDTLSAGIGTLRPKLPGARTKLEKYMRQKGLGSSEPELLCGHPVPVDGAAKKVLHGKAGVLVGDAAGLVDPLTGEGIYYALLSGKIAGEELSMALYSGRRDLHNYSVRINREISKKLKSAAITAAFLYRQPEFAVKLIGADPSLGRLLLEVICGGESYNTFLCRCAVTMLAKRPFQWKAEYRDSKSLPTEK
ncbi:MAG: geranylgeranyl reductase family protein [Bacillota bacterium]